MLGPGLSILPLSSIECQMEGVAVTPKDEETEAQSRSLLFKWIHWLKARAIYEENFLEPVTYC